MASKNKAVQMMTIFPALITMGKLVQNKGPERFLKSLDSKENKSPKGKLGMFRGYDLLQDVFPDNGLTPEAEKKRGNRFNKVVEKLVHMGLLEEHKDNQYLSRNKRTYRLTNEARSAVRYL